ncbi:phosphatidate cytidylyltransferase [Corynebacterium renale]|uniref:Phosphatidate cytidylyltransferase n=1 Tax=Corynebacterium renale TaxID=1724 RepID=A0A2A9DR99_9CORY|nr:phosphatidate cytidylyltransferase [Corynebacterium renale]PFG28502.1 phosphatidate cytidylyltransferase [Corynebacterium renale]SQG64903.1 phosphatidate cytidylyltransferase [Corynebacterium renale]SQI26304.1 phosphatidate cytidylyltransferase [Corynebacterium renale]STC96641.1 phosphatidate cytidylyltransferase [Corynebacterium renale]
MTSQSPRFTLGPRNSAGRNLKAAIPVALGLVALVLLALYVGPAGWYPLVALAAGLGTWEVTTRLREKNYQVPRLLLIAGGQLVVWASWPFGVVGALSGFVASVMAVMVRRLFINGPNAAPKNYLRDLSTSIFVLTWVPLFASFAAMIMLIDAPHASGSALIIAFMACVIASDTGGYVAGVFFGSHPMAPAVSPKKSWEGFAGSVITAAITGAVAIHWIFGTAAWLGIILGVLLAVCATLGDLVESQFKRELGIKDMSALLPGHGGLMDRLDGMLPAATVTWLILTILVSSSLL